MEFAARVTRSLVALETVRCLQCSWIYSKPLAGGTADRNPGCPMCGYVGWLSVGQGGRRAPRRKPLHVATY
jgi:hypothetical protein